MLEFRKARRADAKAAWDIGNSAIMHQCAGHYPIDDLRTWTDGEFSEQFADHVESHFQVAIQDGKVVGTGMIDLETGKIDAMFVHPDYMRRGVGRKMIEYLERIAREKGLVELNLESTLNAAPFYRACGFQGEAIGKYASPRGVSLDCIPMVKVLAPDEGGTSSRRTR